MAERRKARSGTGTRTSTRRRAPAGRDEPELLDEEPAAADEDELDDAADTGEPDGEPGEDEPNEDEPGEDELGDEMLDDEMLGEDEPEDEPPPKRRSSMTAGQAAKAALREIAELTAKQPEGITGVERTEDGWMVGIELVEDQRIPSSADILATYQATLDADGDLVSYKRVRRYSRGHADSEDR
jgi:hypothetical protein